MSDGRAVLTVLALLSSIALATSAASQSAPAPRAAPTAAPTVVASLKELMGSTVDPAADGIWDAVAVKSTKEGVEYRQPRTAEEWAGVRSHAITLIEAMNLVALPGRRAAPPGTKPGLGELDPAQIEHEMVQKRALFLSLAQAVQKAAQQTLAAIDRKDTADLMKTGGDIDSACEACHVIFWYPRQP